MRNKLDDILLSLLWLSISILGASFWFNIKFGFNIFSSVHWQHLAYMQASQQPVKPDFYISIVLTVIVMIFGLYLLLLPRYKKKHIKTTLPTTAKPITQPPLTPVPATVAPQNPTTPATLAPQPVIHQTPTITPAPTAIAPQTSEIGLSRPPRLNISITPSLPSASQTQRFTAPAATTPPPTQQTSQQNWQELPEIFKNAGYTTKENARIGNLQTNLIAIGTNETLWIGAVGVPTTALQSAIDTIQEIFNDTLDDVIITIHGFVISAPDAAAPGAANILTFATPSELRTYMESHKNPAITDNESFDAFSTYISTVIDYISKI